ncbi:MAG: N-acetyltransferase [Mycobacteriaceae bacterium]|nr:N-acetyltransferase [Mycobacteriaceae bacterium]
MLIRREQPGDIDAIRAVVAAAFADPGRTGNIPPEARLVDQLRGDVAWQPRLSLVAVESGGAIAGHVVCTRGRVGATPALAAAPLSVRPDRQRKGIGSALVHAVLAAADALDEPMVALLGDPDYYGRFGFRPAGEYRIMPPTAEWTAHFQVRTLTAFTATMTGEFTYPRPFDSM